MQTVIRSRFGAFACVGAFVYLPRTSTSSMTASNKTIEELKAVVTEELQVLKGQLGTVNGFSLTTWSFIRVGRMYGS